MIIGSTSIPGEFRQAALNEPLVVQVGDTVQVIGNQVIVTRGSNVVATRFMTGEVETVPLGAEQNEVLDRVMFFWRPKMPGVVATQLPPRKNTTTGAITFPYSDGNELEFSSGQQALDATAYLDTDNTVAKHFLIRKTLLNSPDETNLTTMVGATCTIDCNATQPVSVTTE
jgi:hypothetical protein